MHRGEGDAQGGGGCTGERGMHRGEGGCTCILCIPPWVRPWVCNILGDCVVGDILDHYDVRGAVFHEVYDGSHGHDIGGIPEVSNVSDVYQQ